MAFFRKEPPKPDDSVDDLSTALRVREERLTRRENLLARKAEELSDREATVDRRLKEIEADQQTVIDRILRDRLREVEELRTELEERQQHLITSQQRLAAWEADLKQRDAALQNRSASESRLSLGDRQQLDMLQRQSVDFKRRLSDLEAREARVEAESRSLKALSNELAHRKADLLKAEHSYHDGDPMTDILSNQTGESSLFDSVLEQHSGEEWHEDFLLNGQALSSHPIEDLPSSDDGPSALDSRHSALDDSHREEFSQHGNTPTPTLTHCTDVEFPRSGSKPSRNPREMSVLMADQMLRRGILVGSSHVGDDDSFRR